MKREPLDPIAQANSAGMLFAMGARRMPIYEGTVPEHVIAKRRAKNRAARRARRANRHG